MSNQNKTEEQKTELVDAQLECVAGGVWGEGCIPTPKLPFPRPRPFPMPITIYF